MRKTVIALVDQAAVSGSNFLVTVVMARALGPADYGIVASGYALALLAKNAHLALITTPILALVPAAASKRERAELVNVIEKANGTVIVILAALAAVVTWWAVERSMATAAAVASLAFGLMWHEFHRKHLLAETRRGGALLADATGYGGQLVAVAALAFMEMPQDVVVTGFIAAASAGMVLGFLVGWGLRGVAMGGFSGVKEWRRRREVWSMGLWLLGLYAAVWISERWMIVKANASLEPGAAGQVAVALGLLNLLNLIYLAIENFGLPELSARIFREGKAVVEKLRRPVIRIGLPLVALAYTCLAFNAERVVEIVYGNEYDGVGELIRMYGPIIVAGYVARLGVIAQKSMRDTRGIFIAHGLGAMAVVGAAGYLLRHFGAAGAVFAIGIGQVLTAVVIAVRLRRSANEAVRE